MPEMFKDITAWLTTSGIKVLGILIAFIVLSQQWDVGRELRRRIKIRFDEKGIQVPFPHRVLIWGDKNQKSEEL